MKENHFDESVADLARARETCQFADLPSGREPGFGLNDGYEIGRALHFRLVEQGYRSVGRKIGFTNPATWKEFNLDTPIWAHIYSQTVHFAEEGHFELPIGKMVAPRIEPEVVFKLRSTPPSSPSIDDLVNVIEWAAIGFEIVDCHYPDWRFTAADAVADFGVHGALVIGAPWQFDEKAQQSIAQQLEGFNVELRKNGDTVAHGEGKNALGSPLNALLHLSNVLGSQSWAPPLGEGEVITTGTLTPLPPIHPGERWSVGISGAPLQPLEMHFTD